MTRTTLTFGLLSLTLFACAAAQRPATFSLQGARPDAVGDLVRALAANGQEAEVIDRESGVVHTYWQDTGFRYGKVQNMDATIVRRYTVTVQPTASGNQISLRIDGQRCAQSGFRIAGGMLSGACEVMNGVVPSHQTDLDNLAQGIQSTLGVAVVAQ